MIAPVLLALLWAAPADPPSVDKLHNLINAAETSPQVAAVVKRLPGAERSEQADPPAGTSPLVHIDSEQGGVRLTLGGRPAVVLSVTLNAYAGDLPGGLRWDATRRDAERRLGVAPAAWTSDWEFTALYDRPGYIMTFRGDGPRDPDAEIVEIVLVRPEPEAPATRPADAPGPRFTLRLVDADHPDAEMLPDPDRPADALPVSRRALLDESHVEAVGEVPLDDGGSGIGLRMTDAGTELLRQSTTDNVGRRIAFVLDGQVLTAPTINSPIGRHAVISAGRQQDLSDLSARLEAAVYRLPPESD